MTGRAVLAKIFFLTLGLVVFTLPGFGSELMIETGAVWQTRNDVKISPESGSFVELDDYDEGPFFHYRVEFKNWVNQRHGYRVVYAPFSVSFDGQPNETIVFNEGFFLPGQTANFNYTFNSYRATYIYNLWGDDNDFFHIGFTGKIRQAEIRLKQGGNSKSYDNVGFVPLLYLAGQKQLGEQWSLFSDFDLAASPQGQAFDFNLKLRRQLGKSSQLGFGIRTLEGGADNDKVFTWSWFNYLLVDYVHRFD